MVTFFNTKFQLSLENVKILNTMSIKLIFWLHTALNKLNT